jgi:KamA family protein
MSLRKEKKYKPRYITSIDRIPQLRAENRDGLLSAYGPYAFRSNDYYLSLIDWDDPDDPIRKIVIPDIGEMDDWGELDASNEQRYTRVPGLEHKYDSVALLLVNGVCGSYCRFCFRKRLFMKDNDEVHRDVTDAVEYIREHGETPDVLITGGDPLLMSTRRLDELLAALRTIEHVDVIRIGSKLPAFDPFRILNDEPLQDTFERHTGPDKRLYLVCHFNHPREMTSEAVACLDAVQKRGVMTVNQTPILSGINDDAEVLTELFRRCSANGVPPYYVFQCRPTAGNRPFAVPVERAYKVFETAKMRGSGLAKRARLCMSHESGKIEVLGLTARHAIFKYHRAADPDLSGRVMIFRRNPLAYWFDDYRELVDEYQLENPYESRILLPGEETRYLRNLG